jgi:hypothetical protein
MPLRKPPTMTFAAHRCNAWKSTGPRTRQGKAQSRLNALRGGGYSHLDHNLMHTGKNRDAAQAVIAELVEMFRLAERWFLTGGEPAHVGTPERILFCSERSLNVYENKGSADKYTE